MAKLFTSFQIKDINLRNRIVVPPMCQYSAEDGLSNDWHSAHYTNLGRGGAGLVIVEATAVSPEGRITPNCLGIWNDAQASALSKIAHSIKKSGAVPGIQIGHAGRKASSESPWNGGYHISDDDPKGWPIIGPSAIPFGARLTKVPVEMSIQDIERVKQNFVDAAKRAFEAGFEWLELHFAHGYLAQSFFSVHSNHRTDEYGGDFAGRTRFLREIVSAVREVWPERLPLTVRLGAIEYDDRDEETVAESVELTIKFKESGLDLLNVTAGFTIPGTKIPWGPAFLAPIAERIRREANIPIASAWGIDAPLTANHVIEDGQMDLVMIGRAHLANPNWTYQAALQLKVERPSWVLPAPYAHWLETYTPNT